MRLAGMMTSVLLCCAGSATLRAQQPGVRYWHQGVMPPGAIGSRQLQRGGPLPGFFQPVEIKAPQGALISLASAEQFGKPQVAPCRAGLLIGSVYRLRVTNIPLPEGAEGLEVFPSIEVIDRLYAPPGQEGRFAIPVELTQEDLSLALHGKFVTRVIYVEDPHNALPSREIDKSQSWFEAAPGQDPLAVADALGRPVAILRLGGRLPDPSVDRTFFFGSPPYVPYPAPAAVAQKPKAGPPAKKAAAEPAPAAVPTAVPAAAPTAAPSPAIPTAAAPTAVPLAPLPGKAQP
jgi:hypothetical protein